MLSCYRSRVSVNFQGRSLTTSFYWMADVPPATNAYQYSLGINNTLVSTTPWMNVYQGLITEQATIKRLSTKRIKPTGGATANLIFPGGGILGGWPFEAGDYFTGVFLSFHSDNDSTGKHGVRIGPIGSGATATNGWNPLFNTACFNFEALCAAVYTHPMGFDFRGCVIDQLGLFQPITGAQIHWPPCRQIQRRRIL